MKKIQILSSFTLITFFILGLFYQSHSFAQEQLTTISDNNNNDTLILSPSLTYVYDEDYGKTYNIKIENNSNAVLHIFPKEIHILKKPSDTLEIIQIANIDKHYLKFDTKEIQIAPNDTYILKTRIKLNIDNFEKYPAVLFATNNSDNTESNLSTELYSVFILQDTNATIDYEITANVTSNLPFVYADTFNLTGVLTNTGNKFFEPTGNISISKSGSLLDTKQITTQIQGVLLSNEQKTFSTKFQPTGNILEKTGIYEIKIDIKATPYSKAVVYNFNIVYIPQEILVGGVITILTIIALTIIIKFKKR